jgi:glutaredoxin
MPRLVVYTRDRTCPDQTLVRQCLKEWNLPVVEVNISHEADAAQHLDELIGCLAVPTLLIAGDDDQPIEPLTPLAAFQSVRNVDRGAVISEPSREGLRRFLQKHGLLS